MNEQIRIRDLDESEINKAYGLVSSVFDEFVAPLYCDEGVEEFKRYINPTQLIERLRSDSFILVVEIESEIIGVIGFRDWSHIFLLFIKGDYQGKGIASLLLNEALKRCKSGNHNLEKITVNSSPNAVAAYKRMGFIATSEEQLANGIRFVPMVLDLVKGNAC